ncbi:MAG: zinc ABC transporter substrate-binding protein [Thiotrichaceae bacterium]|nr:zinc ABC transporter substrate-binding protein [Thiotrichaceae bacterium]PCI12107.1 MAG: zinc ABC transporter substrate-binding protein [Thiotrichales bacterium]
MRTLHFSHAILGGMLLWVSIPAHAALQVFACEPEWAALIDELAADKASVYRATTAQQDVHRIQARPSLIAQVRKADLVICSGAELEVGWLPLLLRRAANPKVQPGKMGYFMAAEQVERLDVHATVDRSMGDVHAAGNPHVHLDPYRMMTIAQSLAKRLATIDPSNADFYHDQQQQFATRWQAAIKKWEQLALPLQGKTAVVHHKDWRYLLNWLGITTVASLEPKPGLPPNANHLARLNQQMKTAPAAMILRASYQAARPSQWLANKSGIPAIVLPYTVGGSDGAQDLFSLYDDTLQHLLNAIGASDLK